MTKTIRQLKNSQVELIVDLNKEDLLSYVGEAESKLARGIKLKGFRVGKAPKEVLRRKIGEEQIRQEALNLAVESSLAKILREEKLDILDKADFKITENSKDKLVYHVTLLIFPEIKLGVYKNLDILKRTVSVAEQEVDSALNSVINSRITLKDIDGPAKPGDRVEIDFTIKDSGVVIDGGTSENHPLVLGENRFVAGFEDRIVGMKTGGRKSFSLKIPADYYQKTIAGKELDFEIALKKVQERVIPEQNDEFAKSLGDFKNVGELRASISRGLFMEKEEREKDRVRQEVLERIASKTSVKIPEILIERRLDAMIQSFDSELHQKGMELGPYLAHLKKTQDDLKKEWRPKAESQVKASLIIRAVAKEEGLRVGEDEIAAELQIVLQRYLTGRQVSGDGLESLKDINPEELKNRIGGLLLNEKVFNFLEKNSKIDLIE